jgi:hypothetical protein
VRSAALLLLLIAAVGCGDELCDAAALEAALESGGEVRIGACQIDGKFVVPAGATLRGDGTASALKGDGVVLDLMGDATIDGLKIEVGTGIAVLGMASGRVTLNDLEISAMRGGAILGFDGVTSLSITDVTVRGPVTQENARALPEEPTAEDTALYGVAIANVSDARFERLEVGGFGTAGVIATQSQLVWTGGKSAGNVGIGAWIDGGSAKPRRRGHRRHVARLPRRPDLRARERPRCFH